MTSVAEFIKARESIEALVKRIILLVENKDVLDSKEHLDEANTQLDVLRTMVSNNVQVIVVERLTKQLGSLGIKVETMLAKMPVRKTKALAKKKQQKMA